MARDHVSKLLDDYAALEGKNRVQSSRDSIANSIAKHLLHERAQRRLALQPEPRKELWRDVRVDQKKGWDGKCRKCQKAALAHQLIAWDTKSGRPSTWEHVDCANPYAPRSEK